MISDGFFPIFFVATVGGSIELGAFDKGARSIELHFRFDFRRSENLALKDVARLITANLPTYHSHVPLPNARASMTKGMSSHCSLRLMGLWAFRLYTLTDQCPYTRTQTQGYDI